MSTTGSTGAKDRLLSVAAGLFARYGFDGISTRDIAAGAGVSEITVYRHFPRKRDLYCAVLECELRKIHFRGDLLTHVADSPNMRSALDRIYELIERALGQSPALLPLIQSSALEVRGDVEPLLRRYLGQLIEVLAGYVKPWMEKGELGDTQPRSVVLSLVAIVFSRQVLESVFQEDAPKADTIVAAYAECLRHL